MRVSDWVTLNQRELELFLYAIEASAKIRKRYQYYLWAQGALQSFIPHATLMCSVGELNAPDHRCEVFSREVMDASRQQALCDGEDGLLVHLARQWFNDEGQQACVISAGDDTPAAQSLSRYGIASALCHGVPEAPAARGVFFVFLQIADMPLVRYAYIMELLMPHLHLALMRLCAQEQAEDLTREMSEVVLSPREQQVFQWVREGKTNHEIGQILDISPLTVKNHVQKILRKLNVTNRAQAVAKGLRQGVLPPRGSDVGLN